MIGMSSGAAALRRTGALAKKVSKRTAIAGVIGGAGVGGGYYLGNRSSARKGLTSQNKGMYGY